MAFSLGFESERMCGPVLCVCVCAFDRERRKGRGVLCQCFSWLNWFDYIL